MNNTRLCELISKQLNGVDVLLDIGCGEGFLVSCLAKKLNRKIIGLDISPEGFAKAHRKCKRFDVCHLIECIKGDAHYMGMFKDNKFDAVIFIYSLHHMDNPESVLKEAHRVLKPNGKIVIVEFIIRIRKSICHKFVSKEVNEMMEHACFRDLNIQKLEEDIILALGIKRCMSDA